MLSSAVPPVVKSLIVRASPDRAFETFTSGMHRWWPAAHSLHASSPREAIAIEPRSDGRWFERTRDGVECDWGHVIKWEPPRRLLLAWQIGADWKFDPKLITEVEIRFEAQGPDATRVTLEHRNLERFGARTDDTRKALDSDNGWQLGLRQFATLVGTAHT